MLRKLLQIGHPVSVCHQLSLIIQCGKCLRTHNIVSGSHRSPTKLNPYKLLVSYLLTYSPSKSSFLIILTAVGAKYIPFTLCCYTILQRTPALGIIGFPSNKTDVAPLIKGP